MGRCNYSNIGFGMTEREAFNNACEKAMEEHGHEQGYSGDINSDSGEVRMKVQCLVKPKKGKQCKVTKEVQKGTRKWETVFEITDYHSYNVIETVSTTQGDAIKRAKELASARCKVMYINIVKRLVTGNGQIARIEPPKHTMGKWFFSGKAG